MSIPYQSQLFKNIKKQRIDQIAGQLDYTIRKYKNNEIIFKGDEYIDSLGIILKGKVLIAKETSGGSKTMIALLSENAMIGEVMAISGNRISNLVISGSAGTEIMFIPIKKIMEFDELKNNLILMLAHKAFYMNKRVYYLQLKSIKGKISRFLLDLSEERESLTFTLPYNRQKMAEYLNVSRPSLSRELASLKKNQIIDFYKESFKIVDKAALENFQE